jgi:hypothetical protein
MTVTETALSIAKRAYVAGMHGVGSGLEALHLQGKSPPPRASRLRHWVYSLSHVYDAVAMVAMDVPWWTYRAIDEVELWIARRPEPARVFEFGAGASSAWLARRAAQVHSVEHSSGFAELMRPTWDRYENLTVHVVEPEATDVPRTPSGKEGQRGLDFTRYVETIDRVGGTFDLVVVDGRARTEALRHAIGHLASDGIVVFDNSRRARYRPAIEHSGLVERRLTGLTPTLPYPEQTSVLSRR